MLFNTYHLGDALHRAADHPYEMLHSGWSQGLWCHLTCQISCLHIQWTVLHTRLASDAFSNGGSSSLTAQPDHAEVSSDGAYQVDPTIFPVPGILYIWKPLHSQMLQHIVERVVRRVVILKSPAVHQQLELGPVMPLTPAR